MCIISEAQRGWTIGASPEFSRTTTDRETHRALGRYDANSGRSQTRDKQLSALCPRLVLGVWALDRTSVRSSCSGASAYRALSRARRSRAIENSPPQLSSTVATACPLDVGSELWLPTAHYGCGTSSRGERRCFGTNAARARVCEWRWQTATAVFGVVFELAPSCLARALAKKVEHQRVCCKPMAQCDVELDGASRETASGAS